MAIAFIIFVGYLLTELLAHTFIILGAFETAGTISARAFEPFFYRFYNGGVLIKSDFHYLFSSIFFARVAFGT